MHKLDVDPSKIRLWGENPRYTLYEDVNFESIGMGDFEFNPLDYSYNDNYEKNLKGYIKKLIYDNRSIEKMLELVESISDGFNSNIDEILITRGPKLTKELNSINAKEDFFYSLEGNRRITAILLLLDKYNLRDFLKKNIDNSYFAKFLSIFTVYDNNPYIDLDSIEVTFYDVTRKSPEEIWKTLNTRHFGNRKGKMNWPRGLVLESIFKNVKNIREQLKLNDGDPLTDVQLSLLKKKLENFTGKTISILDLKSSLFAINSIYNFNEHEGDEKKIHFSSTNEEGEEKEENIIDSTSRTLKQSSFFAISSLELSMDTIKILTNDGYVKSLSNIIKLNIDVKKWKITSDLSDDVYNVLISHIINLIKNGELNTRKLNSDYESEILSLISSKDLSGAEKTISKVSGKINYENVSLSMFSDGIEKARNKILFSSDKKIKEMQIDNLELIFENIIPIYKNILTNRLRAKEFLDKCSDKFSYAFINLWEIEMSSLIKNNNNNNIKEIPFNIFSSILRSTAELLYSWILYVNFRKKGEIFDEIVRNYEKIKNTNNFKKNIFKKLIDHMDDRNENFEKHIENISKAIIQTQKENCDQRNTFNSILYLNDNLREIVDNFINKISINNQDDENKNKIINKLYDFISWINNDKKHGGMLDVLNNLIHSPHYIKTIVDDSLLFKTLSKNLFDKVNIINDFIEFLMG